MCIRDRLKRESLTMDEQKVWRLVKGVLLKDQFDRQSKGERPIVVHETNDLFRLARPSLDDDLADAERLFRAAHAKLVTAHRKKWEKRVGGLSSKMLERVVQIYLDAAGYTAIDWIKELEDVSYCSAISPKSLEQVLISVRGGSAKVERKGVGELYAGLNAKGIGSGLLLSMGPLSDEAKDELKKTESKVQCICGDDFVDMILSYGIGVSTSNVQISTMNDAYLDAVLG